MTSVKTKAWAKLNLVLHIVGKRPDGRHNIETVMHAIDLADDVEVTLEPGSGRIHVRVTSNDPDLAASVPSDHRNIAHKAVGAFFAALEGAGGDASRPPAPASSALASWDVQVYIHKRIPVESGLGGGSADAAAVLHALNLLLDAPLNPDRLMDVAAGVGSDVPFFLHSTQPDATGAAFAAGAGEALEPLPSLSGVGFVVAVPDFGLSTRDMYDLWDAQPESAGGARHRGDVAQSDAVDSPAARPEPGSFGASSACPAGPAIPASPARALAEALRQGKSLDDLASLMSNDFHRLAVANDARLGALAYLLVKQGALCAQLTGSGSAVFGMFRSREEAARTAWSSPVRERALQAAGARLLAVEVAPVGARQRS